MSETTDPLTELYRILQLVYERRAEAESKLGDTAFTDADFSGYAHWRGVSGEIGSIAREVESAIARCDASLKGDE